MKHFTPLDVVVAILAIFLLVYLIVALAIEALG